MNNYPPGVTGNEERIAGPDYEEEFGEYSCPECGGLLMAQGYRRDHWVVCSGCKYQVDLELTERW